MNIAIAGYGVEGIENYRYFSADPENSLTIVDERDHLEGLPEGVPTLLGASSMSKLQDFDMVIRTAGLDPKKITTNGKIWSATNEFFAKCPAPIIGVTGSKGKGTTSSFIADILKADGKTVWLVGNIGVSSISVLDKIKPDDIVVYELSSFQLWDIERSPETAVVLFIEQEHLDVHADMDDYVNAKARITKFQKDTDRLIFAKTNGYAMHIASGSPAQTIGFPSPLSAHVKENIFFYGEQEVCSTNVVRIPGAHNIDNAVAAIDAVWPYLESPLSIEKGLAEFSGLPHRLAYVDTVDNVRYYDDSIATTPSSAIAALRAFEGEKVIILGGSSKGSDFTGLATEMQRHDVFALLIGEEAPLIASHLSRAAVPFHILEDQSMKAIVEAAADAATPGSVVLLSPSAASFGLFKNYADRGDQFIAAVKALEGEHSAATA